MQEWLDQIREVTNQMMLDWSDQFFVGDMQTSGATLKIREQLAEQVKPNFLNQSSTKKRIGVSTTKPTTNHALLQLKSF